MALVLGRSVLAILGGLALLAAPSCVVEDKGDDDDDNGCEVDFDCFNGEICDDGQCIPEPAAAGSSGNGTAGSSSSAGTSGSGTGGSGTGTSGSSSTGGSAGTNGSGGRNGTSGSTGSGGSGTAGSDGGSGGSGGSGGTGVCAETDPITCPSEEEMTLCIDGALETWTCVEACVELGFELGPCEEPDGCACGGALDEECEIGASALCSCETCTNAQFIQLYIGCYLNDPPALADALHCLVDYVDEEAMEVDCSGVEACAPVEE